MKSEYLRRIYIGNRLIRHDISRLPCDLYHWKESQKLDRVDFEYMYETDIGNNDKTTIVTHCEAVNGCTGIKYCFDLLFSKKTEKRFRDICEEYYLGYMGIEQSMISKAKSKNELKLLIINNFLDLFCLHNPEYVNERECLNKICSSYINDVRSRDMVRKILKNYFFTPLDEKKEKALIDNVLNLIDIYEKI